MLCLQLLDLMEYSRLRSGWLRLLLLALLLLLQRLLLGHHEGRSARCRWWRRLQGIRL